MNSKILLPILLFTLSAAFADDMLNQNIDVQKAHNAVNNLRLEKKVNRSLFLPELSLTGGVGSEKLLDKSDETDKGPFLFLDGKLNLYRGGRDSNVQHEIDKEISIAKIEEEIKKRDIRIETHAKITEIRFLEKEASLISEEIERNLNQQKMARKKVDAGLTTSVDLVDFDLKDELLKNDLDKNDFKTESLKKELAALYGNKFSLDEILKNDPENSDQSSTGDINSLPEFILAKNIWEKTNLAKKVVKGEYLPSVDLEAKYGQITPQHVLFKDEKEHQVALSVTFPLFSGFSSSAKYSQAVNISSQAERELRQVEVDLTTKRDSEKRKIELLKKNLSSLEKQLNRSLKYSELTLGDYKRGVKNSPDVIAAADKKFEVQKKILEVSTELNNALFSFNETFKSHQGN